MTEALPSSLGYRHPAEWEPHVATWLAWPHQEDDWPGKLDAVAWAYVEMIRKLVPHERVRLVVSSEDVEKEARDYLLRSHVDISKIDFLSFPTDRGWMRDSAPSFVVGKEGVAMVDWRFNGWAKYDNHLEDDRLPERIAEWSKMRRFVPTFQGERIVLEGGGIDLDGEGTILTTEECLLSEIQQRNPGMSKEDYERAFADYLGATKTLWLNRGVVGDDTHGHIDDIARFVRPGVIVAAYETRKDDENYEALAENWERLQDMRDAKGRKIEAIKLPMPDPIVFEDLRLPASYANFYIANQVVIVPTFNDVKDREALGILAELFPDREVVGIHAVDLVWGLGTLHCLSHEEPLARR